MTVLQMLVGGDAPIDYPPFVKPIDETRNNDTTLTADTHLQFVTEPNTIYWIRGGFIAYAALDARSQVDARAHGQPRATC